MNTKSPSSRVVVVVVVYYISFRHISTPTPTSMPHSVGVHSLTHTLYPTPRVHKTTTAIARRSGRSSSSISSMPRNLCASVFAKVAACGVITTQLGRARTHMTHTCLLLRDGSGCGLATLIDISHIRIDGPAHPNYAFQAPAPIFKYAGRIAHDFALLICLFICTNMLCNQLLSAVERVRVFSAMQCKCSAVQRRPHFALRATRAPSIWIAQLINWCARCLLDCSRQLRPKLAHSR